MGKAALRAAPDHQAGWMTLANAAKAALWPAPKTLCDHNLEELEPGEQFR